MFKGNRAELPPALAFTITCKCNKKYYGVQSPTSFECDQCHRIIEIAGDGDDLVVTFYASRAEKGMEHRTVEGRMHELRGSVFEAKRENGVAACSACSMRYELFLDPDGELIRAVPRPLPETGG